MAVDFCIHRPNLGGGGFGANAHPQYFSYLKNSFFFVTAILYELCKDRKNEKPVFKQIFRI